MRGCVLTFAVAAGKARGCVRSAGVGSPPEPGRVRSDFGTAPANPHLWSPPGRDHVHESHPAPAQVALVGGGWRTLRRRKVPSADPHRHLQPPQVARSEARRPPDAFDRCRSGWARATLRRRKVGFGVHEGDPAPTQGADLWRERRPCADAGCRALAGKLVRSRRKVPARGQKTVPAPAQGGDFAEAGARATVSKHFQPVIRAPPGGGTRAARPGAFSGAASPTVWPPVTDGLSRAGRHDC